MRSTLRLALPAMEPELDSQEINRSAAVKARNRRRQSAASRVIDLLGKENGEKVLNDRIQKIAALYALTSFEFFDSLVESCGNAKEAAKLVHLLAKVSLASEAW